MYRKNKRLIEKWLKGANEVVKGVKKYGKRAEKLTNGIVRTYPVVITRSTVTEEDLLQPLLVIRIEMVNDKKCKEIHALIEMLKGEEIQFTHVACAGHHDLEKVLSNYKATIRKIREFITELLGEKTIAKKEARGT